MRVLTFARRWIAVASVFLSVLIAASAGAQTTKRPLTHNDFDAWRSIATPVLSRDGKWLAYSVQPQDGHRDKGCVPRKF